MAKDIITYSCGHEGEIRLSGPRAERERKLEWARKSGKCPECFAAAKRAERDAAGPTVHYRVLHGHDPAREEERYRAAAIRAQIKVDQLEELEAEGKLTWTGPYKPDDLKRARRKVEDLERQAREAAARPTRKAALEIAITTSYQVREQLSERGYKFERDAVAVGGGVLGAASLTSRPEAAWCKAMDDETAIAEEIKWLRKQGWKVEGRVDPLSVVADALMTGRRELLPGAKEDTIEAAEAAREEARRAGERAREQAQAAYEEQQAEFAKAKTFRVGDRPGAVELDGDRITARSRDGRTATGWVLDGDWVITEIGDTELGAASAEGERIGREAREQYRSQVAS